MIKAVVVPLDKDWHLKLSSKSKTEAKARKALEAVERRSDLRLVTRPKRLVPASGWADPGEKLFTLEQIADHFQVEPVTIKRAVGRGELIAELCGKDGKVLRFSRAAISDYKTFLSRKRHG